MILSQAPACQLLGRRIRSAFLRASDVEHPLVREGLDLLGIEGGIEITSVADIPAKGTGLGSSSRPLRTYLRKPDHLRSLRVRCFEKSAGDQ